MSSSFDRWEKDPFFSAAEEVQESADRMESIYRRWMHERKDRSKPSGDAEDLRDELRRELHTALGTAKWQLEEFDRASRSSDKGFPADDDSGVRHSQFVSAIGNQILEVENSLMESELEEGGTGLSWVRLDDGERDELAAFLSGSPPVPEGNRMTAGAIGHGEGQRNDLQQWNGESMVGGSRKPPRPVEFNSWEAKEEKKHGHRRSVSAGNDIGAWAISVTNEDGPARSIDGQPHHPLPKVLSLSELAGAVESTSKMNWTKNGFRKWKVSDQHYPSESIPLQNHQVSRGFGSCYERSKSCISGCSDEAYNKQLYGWIGALHRQLQRSQYQIQYGRPVQVIFWVVAALLLIVLFVLRAF